jgi:hypothetical protein
MTLASPFRGLATRVGAGGLANRLYHAPRSALRTMLREGGPLEQGRTERGRLAMVEAAKTLPRLVAPHPGAGLEVHFLSGARYWYQTLFCAWSLQRLCPERVTPVIHDDGSFTEETMGYISRAIPWTRFASAGEIKETLDERLPAERFPTLRARRIEYPHLRKLTDVHVGARGWTLVLDSDMLFFRKPEALLQWLATPDRPCHMLDIEDAYGYSPALLRELAGEAIPERVNVGICGLRSEAIDWDRLEAWCGAQLDREGPNYLQEQALTAMLLSGQPARVLAAADYVVKPTLDEGRNPGGVLHHYVAESKRSYFQVAWRRVLEAGQSAL